MHLAIWETAKISLQAAQQMGRRAGQLPRSSEPRGSSYAFLGGDKKKKKIPIFTRASLPVEGKDVLGYYLLYLLGADMAQTHSSFRLSITCAHRYTYYYKYANNVLH